MELMALNIGWNEVYGKCFLHKTHHILCTQKHYIILSPMLGNHLNSEIIKTNKKMHKYVKKKNSKRP